MEKFQRSPPRKGVLLYSGVHFRLSKQSAAAKCPPSCILGGRRRTPQWTLEERGVFDWWLQKEDLEAVPGSPATAEALQTKEKVLLEGD